MASTLNPIGSGFWRRIARGTDDPARMIEASRLSSMLYGCPFASRYPPKPSDVLLVVSFCTRSSTALTEQTHAATGNDGWQGPRSHISCDSTAMFGVSNCFLGGVKGTDDLPCCQGSEDV